MKLHRGAFHGFKNLRGIFLRGGMYNLRSSSTSSSSRKDCSSNAIVESRETLGFGASVAAPDARFRRRFFGRLSHPEYELGLGEAGSGSWVGVSGVDRFFDVADFEVEVGGAGPGEAGTGSAADSASTRAFSVQWSSRSVHGTLWHLSICLIHPLPPHATHTRR